MMKQHRYKNVFEALEDDSALAENLKIRSRLMTLLSQHIVAEGLAQQQAATLFDVSQPRVSDLMRGKIERFTIDKHGDHAGSHRQTGTVQGIVSRCMSPVESK